LQEFRFLSPNFALVPGAEPAPSLTTSVSSILNSSKDDDSGSTKRSRAGFLASQIVPSPGTQIALWTLADPDGDNVTATFSIRPEAETTWTDLAVSSREPYISFDTARLADGVYFTRLVATEAAPRPAADRLSITFETDHLVVDHTAPAILEATATRTADALKLTVRGRDALSLLEGVEINLNNGIHETVEQPADGIRDAREETFIVEIPHARATGATRRRAHALRHRRQRDHPSDQPVNYGGARCPHRARPPPFKPADVPWRRSPATAPHSRACRPASSSVARAPAILPRAVVRPRIEQVRCIGVPQLMRRHFQRQLRE